MATLTVTNATPAELKALKAASKKHGFTLAVEDGKAVAPMTERAKNPFCGATTKGGTECMNMKGSCPHHKAATAKGRKAAPKVERKTEGLGEGKALVKGNRKAFISAYKAEFGVDLKGKSTKEVAATAIAEGRTPKGFRIGARYVELMS